VPSLPNVKVPNVPLPSVPAVPGVTNGAGGQSTPPDPQALLDYLLSP
jgi:hypothetical protein